MSMDRTRKKWEEKSNCGCGGPGERHTRLTWANCDIWEVELFSLKFTAKQLARQSKKSEKDEAKEKLKVKKVWAA